jgi:hypothetical protein
VVPGALSGNRGRAEVLAGAPPRNGERAVVLPEPRPRNGKKAEGRVESVGEGEDGLMVVLLWLPPLVNGAWLPVAVGIADGAWVLAVAWVLSVLLLQVLQSPLLSLPL